jgi:hypothetical protein
MLYLELGNRYMTIHEDTRRLNFDLTNVGLRAQATAAGFVQLCKELRAVGVIDDYAVSRIKDVVADNITLNCPRKVNRADYRQEVSQRLEAIFEGQQRVGDINDLLHVEENHR